jgi:hypothetical protein
MATYYKYQNPSEIGAAPTLDWGTVISNVNQNLQNQEKQRYENREADKQLANDVLTEINKISQSSDPTLGALIQNHAADIKNNMFNRLKLVQENKDSRSNYKIFKQNTSASIAGLDAFVKNWEPTYKAMSELRAKGLTTKMADAAQDIYGGFQNFKNKKLIQNQNDGFTYTVDIDPETNKPRVGAFGILPFETLNNIKNFTDLKVNLTEKAAGFTDKMKSFITVEMKNGVRTLETPNQEDNKNYADFLENAFNSVAFNNNVIADILTNYSDWKPDLLDYNKSNPTDRIVSGKVEGGNIISDITPAMREEAKGIFEKQLLSQVKYEETPRAEFSPSAGRVGGTDKGKKEVVTTTNDISLAGGRTIPGTGEYTGVSNFTIKQTAPIVDMSTGKKRKLKNIYFDTENPNNIRMVVQIQDTDDPTKTKDVSYSSFKRTEKIPSTRPGGKPRYVEQDPDLAELNNFATKIYSPELGRYLDDWTELIPILQQRGQSVRNTAAPSNTQTKTVIKRSELAAKAAAAGYSAIEYEKLLKQKGVKIE